MGGPSGRRLKEYQLIGLNWLWLMWQLGLGGILADEMGLGKTIQVISLLCAIKESGDATRPRGKQAATARGDGGVPPAGKPHLVVAPASTLDNWQRELSEWAPSLLVVKYHGPQRERASMRDEFADVPFDVLLTTYSYFEGAAEAAADDRRWLKRRQWGLCVLDEGHALKKMDSSRYSRLSQLSVYTRLLLTGTPVQNNLSELLAMLSFAVPTIFPPSLPAAFEELERARAATGGGGASGRGKGKASADSVDVSRARRMLAPFVLRRKKVDVLTQLVSKVEKETQLPMTGRQRDVYAGKLQAAREFRDQQAASAAQAAQQRGRGGKRGASTSAGGAAAATEGRKQGMTATSLFSALRKAANHPCLLRAHYTDADVERIAKVALRSHYFGEGATLRHIRKELADYSDFRLHLTASELGEGLTDLVLGKDVILDSAKFVHLRTLLPALHRDGHRVLIFSQQIEMLDILEYLLGPSGLRLRCLRLDGSTAVAERQAMIDKFQKPESKYFAFLLSTRAGGQGINLTAADTVIIHDLDWNPQLDRQAEDRAHRLGQQREVTVHRLVTAGSVEESILALQRRKRVLGNSVLGDGGSADADDDDDDDEVQVVPAPRGAMAREEEDDDDEGVHSSKIDATMMSAIIEHALGIGAKS